MCCFACFELGGLVFYFRMVDCCLLIFRRLLLLFRFCRIVFLLCLLMLRLFTYCLLLLLGFNLTCVFETLMLFCVLIVSVIIDVVCRFLYLICLLWVWVAFEFFVLDETHDIVFCLLIWWVVFAVWLTLLGFDLVNCFAVVLMFFGELLITINVLL